MAGADVKWPAMHN